MHGIDSADRPQLRGLTPSYVLADMKLSVCAESFQRTPFFLRVRMPWADNFIVTFLPSTINVFF